MPSSQVGALPKKIVQLSWGICTVMIWNVFWNLLRWKMWKWKWENWQNIDLCLELFSKMSLNMKGLSSWQMISYSNMLWQNIIQYKYDKMQSDMIWDNVIWYDIHQIIYSVMLVCISIYMRWCVYSFVLHIPELDVVFFEVSKAARRWGQFFRKKSFGFAGARSPEIRGQEVWPNVVDCWFMLSVVV